ncbi:hypothetical protein PFISCL1PPCAC_6306, partial [Pristionchus fissidentatus]
FSPTRNIMVQTRKQLSQLQDHRNVEKPDISRTVPLSGRITNFFQMRKRKNCYEKKDVEVLGKRLRSEVNVKQHAVEPNSSTVNTPLGMFDRLPNHIFDTFAEFSSWRTLIKLAQTSRSCSTRMVNFIHRDVCVARFVRDVETYASSKNRTALEDPFVNMGHLCRTVFHASDCSSELMQFCNKASERITELRRWSQFLFIVSSLLSSSSGTFDHCKQIINLMLDMKIPSGEFNESKSIKELITKAIFTKHAGELPADEMKVREILRDLFVDQTRLDEQHQAILMTCLMRTFPKLQQQARLLMITLAPTTVEDGIEVIDWRSLCDRDVTNQIDAERRVKPLASFISKLLNLGTLRDRSITWTNTELFNLIEEVSTCPEPWAFDNFIAFLIQEPSLIPIALAARMTHDYVEEAGNLVSAMKTLLFRWNIPFSLGLSEAFVSTMKSLSIHLRREFLSSVHEAHARSIKSLVQSSRGEIEEEIGAQAQFTPLIQEVVLLL